MARHPAPATKAMLLQTLLGSWPLALDLHDGNALRQYAERIRQWQRRPARSQVAQQLERSNDAYENACARYIDSLLLDNEHQQLHAQSVADAAQLLACPGALNGLVQALLRMTTPGVPACTRATLGLQPGRPGQPPRRGLRLQAGHPGRCHARHRSLLAHWRDGRIKQALIARLLDCRQAHADLFRRGAYLPLTVQGRHADHVIAFARLGEGERVVVAPRTASGLLGSAATPLIPAQNWDDTRLVLPFALSPANSTGLFPCAAVSPPRS